MNKVSVLMPIRNNLKYVKESINSILDQTHGDFELLIADDGSTEPVLDLINTIDDDRIKVISNKEWLGVPATLNKLLDLSTGDFICRQDSDDLSDKRRFELQVKALKGAADYVTSRYGKINENGDTIRNQWMEKANSVDSDFIKANIGKENLIVGGAPMWTRKVFDKIGYFDPALRVAQDYNYWIRILNFFDLEIIDEKLYFHRAHCNSHRKSTTEYVREVKGQLVDFHLLAHERALNHTIIKELGEADV